MINEVTIVMQPIKCWSTRLGNQGFQRRVNFNLLFQANM